MLALRMYNTDSDNLKETPNRLQLYRDWFWITGAQGLMLSV